MKSKVTISEKAPHWLHATFLAPLPTIFPCSMHFALATVTSWADLRTLEALPLQVLCTRCSLRLYFLFTPHSAVLCSVLPPPTAFSEHPCLHVYHLPWLGLCYFPPCLFVTHCLSPPLECKLHEGQRAEILSALNPGLPAVHAHHRWLGQMPWVREVNGWPLRCFYTVVYSSSWDTWHPQPLVSSASRLSGFCFRWVGPGICRPSQTPSAMYTICSSHSGQFSQCSMSFQMSMPLYLLIHLPKLTSLILLPSNLLH